MPSAPHFVNRTCPNCQGRGWKAAGDSCDLITCDVCAGGGWYGLPEAPLAETPLAGCRTLAQLLTATREEIAVVEAGERFLRRLGQHAAADVASGQGAVWAVFYRWLSDHDVSPPDLAVTADDGGYRSVAHRIGVRHLVGEAA